MLRTGLIVAIALAGLGAAPAGAAVNFGGGSLPSGKAAIRSVGVSFEPTDAGQVAMRFDTRVLCRGRSYRVSGNAFGAWDGRHVRFHGGGRLRLRGGRLGYHWVLKATLGRLGGAGRVRVTGRRKLKGRRGTPCRRAPVRGFRVLPVYALSGGPTTAPRNASYLGLSRQQVARGAPGSNSVQGAVALRTGPKHRVRARWTADPRCANGYQLSPFATLTPPTKVGPDGRFARDQSFKVRYANSTITYATHFDGGFTTDGTTGTLRIVAAVAPRGGAAPFVCDSGVHAWDALRRG